MFDYSIIIPVYNTSLYVERCLKSVLGQTHKNIEIIVIDDGSTDDSLFICNAFAAKYENIHVYTKLNQGQGVARNYGLERARGRYVAYVDSDDWIEPTMCEDILQIMNASNADFVNFGMSFFDDTGAERKTISSFLYDKLIGHEIFIHASLDDQVLSTPWNKVYRREFLLANGIKFPPLRAYEDIYYSRAVAACASNTVFVSRVFYHALVRVGSTSRKMDVENFEIATDLIALEWNHIYDKQGGVDLERIFRAHVIKFFSYLLVQAAFRIEDYEDYLHCFELARRVKFFYYASQPEVMKSLKLKNRMIVAMCKSPSTLRSCAFISKSVGINPY